MSIDRSILICGGQGNLGSWLTRHFLKSGMKVDVLTRRPRRIPGLEGAVRLQCDLSVAESVASVLRNRRYGTVIHAAGYDPSAHAGNPEAAWEVNVHGTRHLLDALDELPPQHFVYISSFQVYGRWSGIISDDTPPAPVSEYGLTRLFAEEIIRMKARRSGRPHSIMRLTNSYGCPTDLDTSQWGLLLNDLARQVWQHGCMKLRSDGQAWRDFIWMGDVCRILEQFICADYPVGQTMNISRGKSLQVLDVVAAVSRAWHRRTGTFPAVFTMPSEGSHRNRERLEVRHESLRTFCSGLQLSDRLEEEATAVFTLLDKGLQSPSL